MSKLYLHRNLTKILHFRPNFKQIKAYSVQPVNLAFKTHGTDGTASPVIVLHALFGAKNNWRRICSGLKDKLQPKRIIYAIDARNHGDSPNVPEHTYEHLVIDLENFIRHHNINKAVVVGHSMGGRAAMCLALKNPNLVERAVILDVSPVNFPSMERNKKEYKAILASMRSVNLPSEISLIQGRKQAKEQMSKILRNEYTINFLLQNLRKNELGRFTWAINVDALDNNIDQIMVFPENLLANQFSNEVLFIAGKQSNYIDPDDWPNIQQIFPNSQLVWVDAGHLIHIDQPKETIELITNFLKN